MGRETRGVSDWNLIGGERRYGCDSGEGAFRGAGVRDEGAMKHRAGTTAGSFCQMRPVRSRWCARAEGETDALISSAPATGEAG